MNPNSYDIFSVSLSLFAVCFAYYTWKNPIDTSFKAHQVLKDDREVYTIGVLKGKWCVKKHDLDMAKSGQKYQFIADLRNNPTVIKTPTSLEEVRVLEYRELSI